MKNIFKKNTNLSTSRHGFKIAIPAIILFIIIFGIMAPLQARASLTSFLGIDSAAKSLVTAVAGAINYILSWLVQAGASLFEGALNIGFTKTLPTIQMGWAKCRDIANMFFILFMVVIAFGTILRIENYGIKKLLPKVIIIALLINFSMVFASAIVDFSNIAANAFIKDIKGRLIVKDANGAITGTFADAINITGTYINVTCDAYAKEMKDSCTYLWVPEDKAKCNADLAANITKCKNEGSIAVKIPIEQTWLQIVLGYTSAGIILIITAFAFFAGAIMLLFRIIAIWFLVTIAPLAYMCYILPSLETHWKKWWHTFLNWCIFAPAYSFFVWMAIQIANSKNLKEIQAEASLSTIRGDFGPLSNAFTINPGEQLIKTFIIVGFLVGGIIVAKQLGIYGADAVMKIAQGAKKGATDWAKRSALKPSKYVGAGALGIGAKLFGGTNTKLGRRMIAKSAQMKQSVTQSKENKAYTNLLKTMNDNDLLREVETANGSRKLIATQEAKRRGLLGEEANRETVQEAMKAMRAYGDEEGLRSLEEIRPDAIENKDKRDAAVERALKTGTHKKWSKEVFKSPIGKEIAKRLTEQLGSEFNNVYNGYSKETKEEVDRALKENFNQNFNSNKDASGKEQNYNLEARRAYAKATGDIYTAFTDSGNKDTWLAQDYIQGLSAEHFAKFKGPESKQMAGKYMTEKQVYGVGIAVTSGKDKEIIMQAAKDGNKPIYEMMETSEVWGGKKPKPTPTSTSTPANTVDLKEQQRFIEREKRENEIRKRAKDYEDYQNRMK